MSALGIESSLLGLTFSAAVAVLGVVVHHVGKVA